MADRPLRPATRRRLGRPLPHQQADRPRAHPEAESISSPDHAIRMRASGISPSFLGLSRSSGQVAHVLRTRSPLSPGQALVLARLACVRRAASVRPEPGSNSPSRSLKCLRRTCPTDSCPSIFSESPAGQLTPFRQQSTLNLTSRVRNRGGDDRSSPALAFGIHCSVVKERFPTGAHTRMRSHRRHAPPAWRTAGRA